MRLGIECIAEGDIVLTSRGHTQVPFHVALVIAVIDKVASIGRACWDNSLKTGLSQSVDKKKSMERNELTALYMVADSASYISGVFPDQPLR
jgi:hypothetical protein